MKTKLATIFTVVMAAFCLSAAPGSAADLTMDLSPASIEIGTFYNGTTLTVSGKVPDTADVVVRVSDEGEELHLKKKGKVAGLLWMNTGDVIFKNAPFVYMVCTAQGVENLDNSPARKMGFAALEDRIEIEPASEDKQFLLNEFIRLKKKQKIYAITPGSVTYGPILDGAKEYKAVLTIPPSMKQGTYTVEVAAVGQGKILGEDSRPLVLRQTGFPEKMTTMAFGHAVWYGVMAVVIAIMAGLLMGTLFKGKGGAH